MRGSYGVTSAIAGKRYRVGDAIRSSDLGHNFEKFNDDRRRRAEPRGDGYVMSWVGRGAG